jgi:membrane associated rhomboid family serine protease
MFLHGSWTHLLLNGVGLLVMGHAVETVLGTRRFWIVFLLSGVVGGVGWALVQGLGSETPCVGASAGVLGFIGAYAALRPHDRFLMIFPIPVTLSARTLALWLAVANGIDLAYGHGHVAYLAHLVGIVTGALYGLALRGGRERGATNGLWR